jgi:surface antigen
LRPGCRLLPLLFVVSAGFLASGCSFSYQLGSLFGKDDDQAQVTASASATAAVPAADDDLGDTTGSISPTLAAARTDANGGFTDSDLMAASQAASAVLAGGRKDASAPWQNPKTGARGTVTPIAGARQQDGFTCHDFLASYVNDGKEAWMQGEACRVHRGKWVVRSMKPWKRV